MDAGSTFGSDLDFVLAFCFDLAWGHLGLGIDNISIPSRQLSLRKLGNPGVSIRWVGGFP